MLNFVIIVSLIGKVFSVESEDDISPKFPFKSKYVKVLGSTMHYIDEGKGDPVLFIHGNPTSVYLWRNIMPHLQNEARIIGIDLIGFGKSDKPDIKYNLLTHHKYVEAFINELRLKRLTLVIHDWGSAIGLYYAYNHQHNVRGIAFMESFAPPTFPANTWEEFLPDEESRNVMLFIRNGGDEARKLVIDDNAFIEQLLPATIIRTLSKEEMDHYREPFLNVADREAILAFPRDIPVEGEPEETSVAVNSYCEWFAKCGIPKLQIYGLPGTINSLEGIKYNQQNMKNYESVYIGKGLHFIQEDHPQMIGRAIADWYKRNILNDKFVSQLSLNRFNDGNNDKLLNVLCVIAVLLVFYVLLLAVNMLKQKQKRYIYDAVIDVEND